MGGKGTKAAVATGTTAHLPGLGPSAAGAASGPKSAKAKRRLVKSRSDGPSLRRRFVWFAGRSFGAGIEVLALAVGGLVAIFHALGILSGQFRGESLAANLLPLAGAMLGLCLASALFLKAWFTWRRFIVRVGRLGRHVPLAVALCLGGGAALAWGSGPARDDVRQLQSLFGGSVETERSAIAHQVFAHYRRANLEQTRLMIGRGMPYDATVREAAAAFGVSHEILMGIAATESSFLPRPSKDGGEGLFQITRAPAAALEAARKSLGVTELDVTTNHRHNIYAGAATFRHYHEQMHEDLFLGLLAYNIGPHNGGLRSIMQNYGATDYVTIQPYLKDLPRDYPIRVLSAALAYRLWTTHFGKLPRYEEGSNAMAIQELGIPGMERASGLPEIVASGK
jgi:hypothetical protein